jgi:hypothetical protein
MDTGLAGVLTGCSSYIGGDDWLPGKAAGDRPGGVAGFDQTVVLASIHRVNYGSFGRVDAKGAL